ncbi:hypothetical protein Dform_01813 [Dehalogenimonas formicexedens]|uniref:Uncharacterized protein n=1 Tax=Dehalogenimonas formicexedens TaxID=1839801 RepID=A0A1P8F9M0_9CHLR|nr:DUF58 domain-containing protein [Dehalogenimonas formicexedens]APV45132.1 hypothetical protein Dform_01813 [Dehalogenimonas formicexedens]
MLARSSRLWLLGMLGLAVITAPLEYAASALALIAAQWAKRFVAGRAELLIFIGLVTVFLVPLCLAPVFTVALADGGTGVLALPFMSRELDLGGLLAVASALPAVFLLARDLEDLNISRPLRGGRNGLHFSRTAVVLGAAAAGNFPAAMIADSPVLFTGAAVFSLAFLTMLLRGLAAVGRFPVEPAEVSTRLVAGGDLSVNLELRKLTAAAVYGCLRPAARWLVVRPGCFTMSGKMLVLNLGINGPPLSGPQWPVFEAVMSDMFGLVRHHREVRPLKLEIVPRARYIRHLAEKYLAGGASTGPVGLWSSSITAHPGRGIDFLGSRPYQPGDRLKDIDWKHSAKLGDIFAKEYARAVGQSAVILSSLDTPDEEAADKLVYNLISSALTLAQEAVPTALAIFNRDGVIKVTAPENPDLALRQLLGLIKDVRIIPAEQRRLQPAEITQLRHTITLLERFATPESSGLLAVLDFEKNAIRSSSASHPAEAVFASLAGRLSPPATIIVVSEPIDEAETFYWSLDEWRRKGYEISTLSKSVNRASSAVASPR